MIKLWTYGTGSLTRKRLQRLQSKRRLELCESCNLPEPITDDGDLQKEIKE